MAEQAEKKEEKKDGGLLQLVMLVLLVVLVAIAGFIAWKLTQLERSPAPADQAAAQQVQEDEDKPPIFLDLPDVTVNLADPDATRFLRAKIKLEVRGEEAKKKVEDNLVRINDLVITVLSSRTFEQIRTPHGKYELKEELVYRINRLLGGRVVKNLFFTDFVAQ